MFKTFKKQMKDSLDKMLKNQTNLYVTDIDKDKLWDTYLNSFEDPNERQTHNCNCCRQFIKNYCNVVAIEDNKIVSFWDFETIPEYQKTVTDLKNLVLNSTITNIFISESEKIGTDKSTQRLDTGNIIWEHLYYVLPKIFVNRTSNSIDSIKGDKRDVRNVFKRSLDEITRDSLETVLELITQNSLYRGQEFKIIITDFLKYKKEYEKLNGSERENYTWDKSTSISQSISKIRNSAIGTLLIDISEGKDLDIAVSAFERMVAPQNYKRPTPVITKSMVETAEKTIAELGFTKSLERRFATPEDIQINNLLYVNRETKNKLVSGNVFDDLKEDLPINPKTLSKVEEIPVETFIKDILPTLTSVEVLFENKHTNNLVSMITSTDEESPTMFKWNNNFSWSYTNAVTDSIKELVKSAGGKVDGELRVSLSWFNFDDLDLHVTEPNGNHISYRNRVSNTSGTLDVDMNAGGGSTRTPVENIIWTNKNSMVEGKYVVNVHNFSKRENKDLGFALEIECNGEVYNFDSDKDVKNDALITVVEFNYSKKNGITINTEVKTKVVSKQKWGLSTNKFQKVSMIMNSPNHWENELGIGNKHLFFTLENAKSDESPRGIYNEFLKEELITKNKRVFEVLGSKVAVSPSDKQVSGLGFSTTQRNDLICKVRGKFERMIKIIF
jgi:hypothetical protein